MDNIFGLAPISLEGVRLFFRSHHFLCGLEGNLPSMFYCDAISQRSWDGRSMLIQEDPMPQIATTKGHRPADAARDLAAKGQGTTLRLVPKTAASTATKHLVAGGSAAAEMIR